MSAKPGNGQHEWCEFLTEKWKFFWMDQKQNSKEDFENYSRRAMGIDANMMHHLAGLVHDKHQAAIDALAAKLTGMERAIDGFSEAILTAKKLLTAERARSERLVEALKFYANPDNYDTHSAWGKVCIIERDTETGVREPFMNIRCGGKAAREAIAEHAKDLK